MRAWRRWREAQSRWRRRRSGRGTLKRSKDIDIDISMRHQMRCVALWISSPTFSLRAASDHRGSSGFLRRCQCRRRRRGHRHHRRRCHCDSPAWGWVLLTVDRAESDGEQTQSESFSHSFSHSFDASALLLFLFNPGRPSAGVDDSRDRFIIHAPGTSGSDLWSAQAIYPVP